MSCRLSAFFLLSGWEQHSLIAFYILCRSRLFNSCYFYLITQSTLFTLEENMPFLGHHHSKCNAGQKVLYTKVKFLKYCQLPSVNQWFSSGKEMRNLDKVRIILATERRKALARGDTVQRLLCEEQCILPF